MSTRRKTGWDAAVYFAGWAILTGIMAAAGGEQFLAWVVGSAVTFGLVRSFYDL